MAGKGLDELQQRIPGGLPIRSPELAYFITGTGTRRLQYVSAIQKSFLGEEKITSLGNPLYKVTDMEPFPAPRSFSSDISASSEECVFKPSPTNHVEINDSLRLHVEHWQYLQLGLKWWVIYVRELFRELEAVTVPSTV